MTGEAPTLSRVHCRDQAKACRIMASGERDPNKRVHLENLAASWEQICEELEKTASKDQPLGNKLLLSPPGQR